MSNADLQQIDGPALFPATADVGTGADPFLIPTDGPKITAASNAAGQAPVKPALLATKGLLLGLRGGIFGDFAGAVKKTVKSMYIDLTGGVTHTKPAGTLTVAGPMGGGVALEIETGDIRVDNNDIQVVTGNILCDFGIVQALNGSLVVGDLTVPKYAQLAKGVLTWIGTTLTASNPAGTAALPNQLRALNTPKAWVSFTSNGVNDAVVVIKDYCAIASMAKVLSHFTVTFATAFDSASYCVTTGCTDIDQQWVEIKNKTTTTCEVWLYDTTGFKNSTSITGTQTIDLVFFGRQTT